MNEMALNECSPEKAGVGGSIPSLATTFSLADTLLRVSVQLVPFQRADQATPGTEVRARAREIQSLAAQLLAAEVRVRREGGEPSGRIQQKGRGTWSFCDRRTLRRTDWEVPRHVH